MKREYVGDRPEGQKSISAEVNEIKMGTENTQNLKHDKTTPDKDNP